MREKNGEIFWDALIKFNKIKRLKIFPHFLPALPPIMHSLRYIFKSLISRFTISQIYISFQDFYIIAVIRYLQSRHVIILLFFFVFSISETMQIL